MNARRALRAADRGADRAGEPAPCPSIEEIQDLVEQALIELGKQRGEGVNPPYRDPPRADSRGARGASPRCRRARAGRASASPSPVRSAAWSEGRIVAALMREGRASAASDAEEIRRDASKRASVRQRACVASRPRLIIAELVDNEPSSTSGGLDGDRVCDGRDRCCVPLSRFAERARRSSARARLDPRPRPRRPWSVAGAIRPKAASPAGVLRRLRWCHVLDVASAEAHLSGEIGRVRSSSGPPSVSCGAALPAELFHVGRMWTAHTRLSRYDRGASRAARAQTRKIRRAVVARGLAPALLASAACGARAIGPRARRPRRRAQPIRCARGSPRWPPRRRGRKRTHPIMALSGIGGPAISRQRLIDALFRPARECITRRELFLDEERDQTALAREGALRPIPPVPACARIGLLLAAA
jgi:hypothetical protein